MITTKQKVLLGALVPLGAAVWVPQLMARMESDSSASIEAEADLELDVMEPVAGGFDDGLGLEEGAVAGDGSSDAPSTEASAALRGPDDTLAAILDTLQRSEAFGAPAPQRGGGGLVALAREIEAAESEDAELYSSPMVDFVDDHPLRGTVTGAVTRFALFGNYRIAEGEMLPGTSARLASVTRGEVKIEESGVSLEVALPPLATDPSRARSATSSDGSVGFTPRDEALEELAGATQDGAAASQPS
ncbi:MAG: hypothetical protein AAFP86_07025, partial [Planctomycetota bacterium]